MPSFRWSDTWSTKQVRAVNFAAKQPLCPRLFPEPNVWSFDSALASFHRRITMWCENRQCGGASPKFCFLDMSQLAFFIGWKPLRNCFGAPLLATVQTLQCAPLLASACACIEPFLPSMTANLQWEIICGSSALTDFSYWFFSCSFPICAVLGYHQGYLLSIPLHPHIHKAGPISQNTLNCLSKP